MRNIFILFILIAFLKTNTLTAQNQDTPEIFKEIISKMLSKTEIQALKTVKQSLEADGLDAKVRLKKGYRINGLFDGFKEYQIDIKDETLTDEKVATVAKDFSSLICLFFFINLSEQEAEDYKVISIKLYNKNTVVLYKYSNNQLHDASTSVKNAQLFFKGIIEKDKKSILSSFDKSMSSDALIEQMIETEL
ncbi:hypothetical protein ACE193_13275 [Bernardetia sp. OM2101]|uniref:hypothetical protein n=1 Tax=Bernardetia sp. OM2101 TaxID=3344876 RepID=UPI0035D08F03